VIVQALRLEGGEAVGNRLEVLAHGDQVFQALLQPEIGQIIGADLMRKKVENISYCFTNACLKYARKI